MKKILLLSLSVIICSPNLLYAQNLVNRSYSPDTTGGTDNAFFGNSAGSRNTGYENAFVGFRAGYDNTTGSGNAFLGSYAGIYNTTGIENVFLGYEAGKYNTAGQLNVFIGAYAGISSPAMSQIPSGHANVFIGGYAGMKNSGGNVNTFIGFNAGFENRVGESNTFIGFDAGSENRSGSRNIYLGTSAGTGIVHGTKNVFLGYQTGYNASRSGSANVFLGYQAGYDELGSNKLYIQNDSTAIPLIYGDFATNQVGIDTKSIPTGYHFAVAGKIAVEEVLIGLESSWPDYVFNVDYDLPTIREVETFIAQNGHLKDIPTAEEVQEHGILQGEMDAKLLKKIEELTLYVIELNERIQTLEEAVNSETTE